VEWILKVGVMMDFVGHGMVGFGRPAAWAAYFGVVGIGHDSAYGLMPWVAIMDVTLGLLVLIAPMRAFVFFMAAWALWTALLRPLAGEPLWEALERAGNYGAPWALFLILHEKRFGAWLRGSVASLLDADRRREICNVLHLTTVALLLGHGALGFLVRKPLLATHYASIGLNGQAVEPWVGAFEMVLSAAVLLRPGFTLLMLVAVWKVATELLSPVSGSSFWVFVEHGGSYAAPLALAFLLIAWRADEDGAGAVAIAGGPLDDDTAVEPHPV
jgi:hypothetical protein